MFELERGDGWIRFACRVIPRARQSTFGESRDGRMVVRLTAAPVDGKANEALKRLLADAFGVPPSRVHIERGATGRTKRVRIDAPARVPAKLTDT